MTKPHEHHCESVCVEKGMNTRHQQACGAKDSKHRRVNRCYGGPVDDADHGVHKQIQSKNAQHTQSVFALELEELSNPFEWEQKCTAIEKIIEEVSECPRHPVGQRFTFLLVHFLTKILEAQFRIGMYLVHLSDVILIDKCTNTSQKKRPCKTHSKFRTDTNYSHKDVSIRALKKGTA